MYNTIHKEKYVNKFLFKRILKVLVPAYFIFAIGVMIKSWAGVPNVNIYNLFSLKNFFELTNWYVWEMILLYILYYVFMKPLKRIGIYGLIVSIIVFSVNAYIIGLDNPWYGSMMCFAVGILFCMKEKEISLYIEQGHWGKIITASGIVVFVAISLFVVLGEKNIVGVLLARNVASIAFCILVITMLYKFSIGNRVDYFLAKYSYEIFLFHPIYISVFRKPVRHDLVYSICVIFCTIISSVLFKECFNAVIKKFRKLGGKLCI